MEELNDPGISEKGKKTNKEEAGSQFQQERNRTQLEKELGRTERSQEMITGPKTKDKKAGALSHQELTTLQESTEQEDRIEGVAEVGKRASRVH